MSLYSGFSRTSWLKIIWVWDRQFAARFFSTVLADDSQRDQSLSEEVCSNLIEDFLDWRRGVFFCCSSKESLISSDSLEQVEFLLTTLLWFKGFSRMGEICCAMEVLSLLSSS